MKLYQALIAGLVACSFAVADSTSTTTTTTTSTTKTAPVSKVKKGFACKQIMGKVVSIDAVANTIIITPKGKKTDDTLSITDSTVVMPKGVTVANIKTDAKVNIAYKVEAGKWVACKITVKSGKKPPVPIAPEAK